MTFFSRNLAASDIAPSAKPAAEDAVALAVTSLNLVVFATAYGFNFAVDAYASVAYGAQDRADLWAVLLRQCVLLLALGVLCFALLLFAEHFFLVMGIGEEMAQSSGGLLLLLGWAVPGDFLYDALARWLRAQQLHQYVAACSVTALGVNLVLNFRFASAEEPTRGPLIALVAQNTVLPVLLMAAYWYSQPAMLKELGKVWPRVSIFGSALWSQLATSTTAMLWACGELWAWEVQVFAAAHLGGGKAAAYVLLSATYSLLIQTFPASIALAAGALVGEALGCGRQRWAQRIFDHACTLALLLVIVYTAAVWSARASVARFLSGGVPEVQAAFARALPLVLAMHYLDGLFVVAKVNLTIRKEQVFGATMTLVIYYALCLPLSFWLAFTQGWDIVGLWAGLSLAVLLGVVSTGAKILLEPADDEGGKSDSEDELQIEEDNCVRTPRGQWFATLLVPGVLALTAFYVQDEPWNARRPLALIQRVVCHGSPLADSLGCPLEEYRLAGSFWAEE
jgi:Na+-driven multidrug efflux pump